MLLCTFFAFALVGCGDTYSDEDDYANFVRWQARYETEKELVGLLREYDAAYQSYIDYTDKSKNFDIISLIFVFEECDLLTYENIVSIKISDNKTELSITFDNFGQKILRDISAPENFGKEISIIEIANDATTVLISPIIDTTIFDGVLRLINIDESVADELYVFIASKTTERLVKFVADNYNNKCSEFLIRFSMPSYLPAALATEPQYTNVSKYLKKIETFGF